MEAGQMPDSLACPAGTGLGNPVSDPDGARGLPLLVSAVRIALNLPMSPAKIRCSCTRDAQPRIGKILRQDPNARRPGTH